MTGLRRWSWFEAFGVELEYMIVSRDTLDVAPLCDRLLSRAAAAYAPTNANEPAAVVNDVELGDVSWSNELALHVVEMKTTDPARDLHRLADQFQDCVAAANQHLAAWDACLLPSAMHPWMDPEREMRLWPHDYNAVYEAFHRLFDCRGHGWANLQSTHWNLPFADDDQFGRLHAAIRLVLPLIPGLAASSPIVAGTPSGLLDTRIDVYRRNSARIPSITGHVVPEPVFTEAEYHDVILRAMYRDVAPHDPDGTLQHIWLNARGAIARFDRGSIEIRLVDIQECPRADLAIGALLVETLRALAAEEWSSFAQQQQAATRPLADLLVQATRSGPAAIVPPEVARLFGCVSAEPTVGQIWRRAREELSDRPLLNEPRLQASLDMILRRGTLAQRILAATAGASGRNSLRPVYERLANCLATGEMFLDD